MTLIRILLECPPPPPPLPLPGHSRILEQWETSLFSLLLTFTKKGHMDLSVGHQYCCRDVAALKRALSASLASLEQGSATFLAWSTTIEWCRYWGRRRLFFFWRRGSSIVLGLQKHSHHSVKHYSRRKCRKKENRQTTKAKAKSQSKQMPGPYIIWGLQSVT